MLSDDLVRFCLTQKRHDSERNFAWLNSICAAFLVVGVLGLKPPKIIVRPVSAVEETPTVLLPEEKPVEPVAKPEPVEIDPISLDQNVPAPEPIRAVPLEKGIEFPVIVKGSNVVLVHHVSKAQAPHQIAARSELSRPTIFTPKSGAAEGYFPPPAYPAVAERNGEQGTAVIDLRVDSTGRVVSAELLTSSGHTVLDEAALQVVLRRWSFTPGKERWLRWSCQFKLAK